MYLLNAFSISMVAEGAEVAFRPIEIDEALLSLVAYAYPDTRRGISGQEDASPGQKKWFTAKSAVGHQSTANVLSNILGVEVPAQRISVALKSGDQAIVAQFVGPRLQEGATELPEGASIKFFEVTVRRLGTFRDLVSEIAKLRLRLSDFVGEEDEDEGEEPSKIVVVLSRDEHGRVQETESLPVPKGSHSAAQDLMAGRGVSERDWWLK